jgi:hypothetical protein
MKGNILSFILIMAIVISVTAATIGWAMMNLGGFFELSEINNVKKEFSECNDKLLDTARTGLPSKCMFSAKSGVLQGSVNDITYYITANTKVCDSSEWVLIDVENNIWQRCDISGRQSTFGLRWNYTGVYFGYGNLGNVRITGQSGSTIEISRDAITDTQIKLILKMY